MQIAPQIKAGMANSGESGIDSNKQIAVATASGSICRIFGTLQNIRCPTETVIEILARASCFYPSCASAPTNLAPLILHGSITCTRVASAGARSVRILGLQGPAFL
jgi:hypothetical protein